MGKVYIIGTGPGARDYIPPLAGKIVKGADVVIGAERLLSLFTPLEKAADKVAGDYLIKADGGIMPPSAHTVRGRSSLTGFTGCKRRIVLRGNYSEVVDYIKKKKDKERIAVLVSGSPGIFSFSSKITAVLKPSEYEIIPGISSLQLACARKGENWDDLYIISLHGKTLRGLSERVRVNKKVMIFCDDKNNPSYVAKYFLKKGVKGRKITIFGNLSLSDEEVIDIDLSSLANTNRNWKGLWLILIKKIAS